MKNLEASIRVIRQLVQRGARDFCVCAGSRNAPLVASLCESSGLNLFSFGNEQAAAYFALGRARRSGRPAVVVTTSGTAAAQLLPALVEAHYSGAPLVALTADRPKRFRGTGAPQSIEQKDLFGPYVEACLDFEANEGCEGISAWSGRRPLHLNVGFDEPLIDGAIEKKSYAQVTPVPRERSSPHLAAPRAPGQIENFLAPLKRPLVIIGALEGDAVRAAREFCRRLGAPVYAESLSNLREDKALEGLALTSGERILVFGDFDGVLRLGGVPTLRFWRDLDGPRASIPVLHLTDLPFAGLARGTLVVADIARALDESSPRAVGPALKVFERDRAMGERFLELLAGEPRSELALINALSRVVPGGSHLFLGNSMPIRQWDLAASRRPRGFDFKANRGANGIDGELSTFLGLCQNDRANWAVLGDLTAIYDLSAPWIVPQLPEELNFQIVVVNNGGGRIFSRLKSLDALNSGVRRRYFENSHGVRFKGWAEMWNLGFEEWDTVPAHLPASSQGIIELRPDADSSGVVWERLDALWARS